MIQVKRLKVFISCPGDMSDERQVAEQAIKKFSELYCDDDIFIEPIHFKQLPSEFGGNAQDIINAALPEYDIYIGIMGARFGAPTKSYSSGTEEEFRIALQKKDENPAMHVAFYFKDVNKPASAFSISEIAEFAKVLAFKERLQEENDGLYQTFSDHDNLANQINVVLKKAVKSYQNKEEQQAHQLEMLTPVLSKDTFSINREYFAKFLNSVGAELSNNHKASVSLSDVYVPLDLSRLNHTPEEEDDLIIEDQILSSETIDNYNGQAHTKVIISGEENSGKTALCKRFFANFHLRGIIPVLIKGRDIKTADINKLIKHVQREFVEQYNAQALGAYSSLSPSKKLLIIDDFNGCKLNAKYKISLLEEIEAHFDHILITVDELFLFNIKVSNYEEFRNLLSYNSYKLRDIGHKLRDKMIQKWVAAGREQKISHEEIFSETEKNRKIIDTMIGRNFVPKKPFVILVLLQAIEGGAQSELAHSSYVRYYRFLIDRTLLSNVPQNRLEVYYAFLPELAFAIYEAQQGLTQKQLEVLIKDFCERKGLHEDLLKDVKSNLLSLEILTHENGEFRFSYNYAYYYFLGQYLSENLDQSHIKTLVEDVCEKLHVRENSNIIVFLSYHSNSPIIIEKIVDVADSLFPNAAVFDFKKAESSALNRLVTDSPKVVIDHQQEKKERERVLASRDKIDRRVDDEDEIDDSSSLDLGAQINLAFRSMEIIGQLLKNHYVRFDAEPKKELHTKAVNLGMKSLNVLISHLSDDLDGLVAYLCTEDQEEFKSARERLEAEKDAKKAIFGFAALIVFSFIKATSQYTGADTLAKTYEDILQENDQFIYKAIDLSIKLDFFDSFPMAELKGLVPEFSHNHLAATVVKNLVKYRLYMRPLDDLVRKQQICDTVGISLKTQLLLKDKNKEAA